MQNSSTGGLDFITMAIKSRHPHMPFGNLTFAAALAVILANGLVFHDVDSIIYGLIFNFLTSYIINRMMFGFNACMMALIVTSDGPAVCRMIGEKSGSRFHDIERLRRLFPGWARCGAVRLQLQATVYHQPRNQAH